MKEVIELAAMCICQCKTKCSKCKSRKYCSGLKSAKKLYENNLLNKQNKKFIHSFYISYYYSKGNESGVNSVYIDNPEDIYYLDEYGHLSLSENKLKDITDAIKKKDNLTNLIITNIILLNQ